MRALVQRVSEACVTVAEKNYSSVIGKGMVILLGVTHDDDQEDAVYCADKCVNLRIFEDPEGKMNLSLRDTGGEILAVSQFTLYGETIKGNRPNFMAAARPELAERLYNNFTDRLRENLGKDRIKEGIFSAMMEVRIHNDGPVTLLIESKKKENITVRQ